MCDCEWLTFRNWLRPICVSPDQRRQECRLIRQSCASQCIALVSSHCWQSSTICVKEITFKRDQFSCCRNQLLHISGSMAQCADRTHNWNFLWLCIKFVRVQWCPGPGQTSLCCRHICRSAPLTSWQLLDLHITDGKSIGWPNIAKHLRLFGQTLPNISDNFDQTLHMWHMWLATSFCRSTTWHHDTDWQLFHSSCTLLSNGSLTKHYAVRTQSTHIVRKHVVQCHHLCH